MEYRINLEQIANNIRQNAARYIHAAGSGHPGGSMSVADILAVLYFSAAQPQPYDPDDPNRDIIILSKGHSAPALYATWQALIDTGHPMPEWWGDGPIGLRKLGSNFQGHPSLRHTPWCETSTGSLGQGFGVAVGMALALKDTGRRVYCVLGDGELQEGMVAEAARAAAWHKLGNLVAIVDCNQLASDRHSRIVNDPVGEFNNWMWHCWPCNGHNIDDIITSLSGLESRTVPSCLVAHTIKGKGVKAWQKDPDGCHGSVTLSDDDLTLALADLGDTGKNQRFPVHSKNLASVGYNSESKELEVEFKNGAVYVYKDVPAYVFTDLTGKTPGGSVGKNFEKAVKEAGYRFERIK